MMADGGMDEFPQKQIILGDVEPDVFAQLARFAYQGLCAVSDGVGSTQIKALINFRCIQCGKRAPREGVYPFCGDACRRALAERMDLYQRGELNKPFMICCTIKNCTSRLLVADKGNVNVLCHPHEGRNRRGSHPWISSTTFLPVESHATTITCGIEFSQRRYDCRSLSSEVIGEHIEAHRRSGSADWPLVQHAKIYVVARKYMVKDLAEICLHKLHRSLAVLANDNNSIEQLIDLVLYTYANTSDEGNVLQGTADELRELVTAYIADRYEKLQLMLSASVPQTLTS